MRGGADESYGIEVAALAGVPQDVIKRAKVILKKIAAGDTEKLYKKSSKPEPAAAQMDIEDMAGRKIIEELKAMDVTTLTAIDAMNKLYELSLTAKKL